MAAGRKGSWSGGGESDGELLVGTADRLRWRAPELALELARQAATRAGGNQDNVLALRANALVVAALVRLGKHAEAVEPAVLALREAESSGERDLAGSVRVDLAASTRAIGLAGSAFVLVRPMLEGSETRPGLRAGALAEIVAGLAQAGRREVIDEVLSEADRLYASDESLGADVRRLLRALLCARVASFRRRWGNPTGAVAAATEGMALLDGLVDPGTDSGQARAELGLEMVSALLDAGEEDAALGQADQTLAYPVRATSAAAVGRLMLILATRVHMPAGRVKEAYALLAEIVRVARRHELDGLLADVLTSLAHAQEADGELTDALESLRSARAAEQRRLRADTMARLIILDELGAGTRLPDDTEALLRRVVRTPARSLPDAPGRDMSMEAASREMAGRELGGQDIGRRRRSRSAEGTPGTTELAASGTGTQDVLGRELAGWEMVARERAAREAKAGRAASELVAADRATAEWPAAEWSGSEHPASDWSERETSARTGARHADVDRTTEERTGADSAEPEQTSTRQSRSRRRSAERSDSDWQGLAAAGSSGGGRRRAPDEWSAADRVAADRAVSGLASSDDDAAATSTEPDAATASGQPKWPDQRSAEERDEETGLLNRQGLRRRLAAARRQSRPTALTLVRLEPDPEPEPRAPERTSDPDSTDRFSAALIKAIDQAGKMPEFDPDVISSLAEHVRDMAPEDAELVRPDEGELAVLLPDTTRDEAEQFAATLRETVSTSVWDPDAPSRDINVSTGVAQYQEGTSEDALLTAAREALTPAEPGNEPEQPESQPVEPSYDLPPEDNSGYTYIEEYAQLSHDGPEPVDQEMAEYLAGFSLPEYGRWPQTTDEPDMPPRHDAASTTESGRSVLDRLDITRGSGGRRRAPDSYDAEQSADYAHHPAQPVYGSTGDEILAAAEEASARASIPPAPNPDPEDVSVHASIPLVPDPEDVPVRASVPPVSNPEDVPVRASIPPVPDPEEVPAPPDTPDIPTPPNPDADPKPGRRHLPTPPDQPGRRTVPTPPEEPGRRTVPVPPEELGRRALPTHPDIDPQPDPVFPPDPDSEPGRRRFPADPDLDRGPGYRTLPAHPDIDPLSEPVFPAEPDPEPGRRRFPADPDQEPGHRTPSVHPDVDPQSGPVFPAEPDSKPGRRRFPLDPEPGRHDLPARPDVDSQPDPLFPTEPGSESGRRRFPADPDRDHEPGRGGLPAQPGIDSQSDPVFASESDPRSGRRGFPLDPEPDRPTLLAQLDSLFPSEPDSTSGRRTPAQPDIDSPSGFGVDPAPETKPEPGFPADPDLPTVPRIEAEPVPAEPEPGDVDWSAKAESYADIPDFSPRFDSDAWRPGGDASEAAPERRGFPYEQEDSSVLPGRRRRAEPESGEPRPGRRRMPEEPESHEQEEGRRRIPAGTDPEPQGGRRRKPEDPTDSHRALPEPPDMRSGADFAAPQQGGRRRAPEPSDPQTPAATSPSQAEPLRAVAEQPSPSDRPGAEASANRWDDKPRDEPSEPEPRSHTDETPRPKRRLSSVLDGEERSAPDDPESARRPSRLRRRERTDLKLADLLAEALVAYQSSTAEAADEDVRSGSGDATGQSSGEPPRRERETGY